MTTQKSDNPMITHEYTCKMCAKLVSITAPKSNWDAYASGALIQNAFPMLDLNAREIMISGICGQCFDEAFSNG